MKAISAALAQHLAGEVTTLATCWRITRRDGVVVGFTDYVRDLEVDGVTYEAASGYTRTAIRSTADLAVDNLDLETVFADAGITKEDLHIGGYRNYESLVQGILSCGTAGLAICRRPKHAARVSRITQPGPLLLD